MADAVRVERLLQVTPEAWALVEEYYGAIGIVVRDSLAEMESLLRKPGAGLWVATVNGEAAGCVVLKADTPEAGVGECKRLYVRERFRRRGLAEALMAALEQKARDAGLRAVYLDTREEFRASVALYRRLGYEEIARYNQNPQATLFFRKVFA